LHLSRADQTSTITSPPDQPGHNFACINIPLNVHSKTDSTSKSTLNYGLVFQVRFDNSLANFSRIHGLGVEAGHAHVASVSLGAGSNEFLEVWLSGFGGLVVARRGTEAILWFTEVAQVEAGVWHFVYVGYEEAEMSGGKTTGSLVYR